jgi:hypothetical protein
MPVHLGDPVGPPGAAPLDDEAWNSLLVTQLADTRKSAENWRTGLIATVGLITGFSIIKGPSDLSGLDPWAAYYVGLVVLAALASAVFGAWVSLAAAYGTPSIVPRNEVQQLGITGYRFNLARRAVRDLSRAKLAMLAALLLFAAAIGTTWYGPRSPSVLLSIERKSMPQVCGKLVSSSNGDIDIQQGNYEITRLPLTDVTKIHAVRSCS